MRSHLEALVTELKRRRFEGDGSVFVSDAILELLGKRDTHLSHVADKPKVEAIAQPQAKPDFAAAPVFSSLQTTTDHSMARSQPSKPVAASPAATFPAPPQFTLPKGTKQEQWNWLREKVLSCPVCNAHARIAQGKKVVFGVGNLDAKIFFCGEAPGADEETQGEPFVGKAGQLLTKIIGAMGLARSDVYIGNILNWRPEMPNMASGNRPPTLEEMAYCLPYLIGQIEIVRPQVIVALGNTAVTGLLGHDPKRRMGKIRGQWQDFRGTPLMPTYHPSYLLQYASQKAKREVWEDMMQAMEKVGLPISEKQRGYFLDK